MGIYSRIWKGIKKTFKKIGNGIKKVFQKVGKFMGKIGIVGQIAMMFVPFGSVFGALGNIGSKALGWLNKFGAIGKGAAKVIGGAYKFARAVSKPFMDISKGITGFITDSTKFFLNKIPGVSISSAPTSIFGKGGAWETAQQRITGAFDGFTGNIADAFSGNIDDLLPKKDINLTPEARPATPEEMYKDVEKGLDFQQEEAAKVIPDQESFKLGSGIEPTVTPDGFEKPSFSMERYLETARAEAAPTAAADLSSLEVFGDTSQRQGLLSRLGEKAIDKVAGVPASLSKDFVGQQLGISDKPMGTPGRAWGANVGFQYPSRSYGLPDAGLLESLDMLQGQQMGLFQGDQQYAGIAGMGYGGPDYLSSYQAMMARSAPRQTIGI